MLPLSLLRAAAGSPLLVELKSGDTYNGRLSSCDAWMNLNLSDVICTSASGDRFWKLPSCYIRGSAIKYLRLPEACLEQAVVEEEKESRGRGAPGRGGRGRGRFDAGGRSGGGGRFDSSRGRGGGRGGGRNDSGGGRGGGRGRGGRSSNARGR